MSRILLGVCGGIAAYKAVALTSFLVQRGDTVDVIMTDEAQRFVGPLTFTALTRRRVFTSLWDEPETIPHIRLVREAELLLIVPATANAIAKLAQGIADDMLTSAALAAKIPIVIAPAMNGAMYEHPVTQANVRLLNARGYEIIEPSVGFLAEREIGIGRLADQEVIVSAIDATLKRRRDLDGEHVVVNAGPTREAIDPVRFLSNASSGTMGIELAREAVARGACVDLVLGPTLVEPPHDVKLTRVVCAQEMCDATLSLALGADIVVATAAVADWKPARTFPQKVKKTDVDPLLYLERTPDIVAMLGARKNGMFLVGFAAETESLESNAREKLYTKNLDAIVVNDVSPGAGGFGTGESEVLVMWAHGERVALGRAGKRVLARQLWDVFLRIRKEKT